MGDGPRCSRSSSGELLRSPEEGDGDLMRVAKDRERGGFESERELEALEALDARKVLGVLDVAVA
ncbi:MAG: hypothetical protein M1819_003946 [Sarea resinae]|nr:MAG: hypothetical protein M1819_003946 [Sarea resinae]